MRGSGISVLSSATSMELAKTLQVLARHYKQY